MQRGGAGGSQKRLLTPFLLGGLNFSLREIKTFFLGKKLIEPSGSGLSFCLFFFLEILK
jgi:hypothetical protein